VELSQIKSSSLKILLGPKWKSIFEEFLHEDKLKSRTDAGQTFKSLRKFYSFIVIADRPRTLEKATRIWLDKYYSGVFDRVVFLDDENDPLARRKEICKDMKIQIAISADEQVAAKCSESIKYKLIIKDTSIPPLPWCTNGSKKPNGLSYHEGWIEIGKELEKIATELGLQPDTAPNVAHGSKLVKYMDDLVTIKTQKPAGTLFIYVYIKHFTLFHFTFT